MVLQLSSLHLELQGLLTQLYDRKMEKGWRPECLTTTDLHVRVQYEDACTVNYLNTRLKFYPDIFWNIKHYDNTYS